jgi:OFA family oxalate/formate antiporter-like MFS transporter
MFSIAIFFLGISAAFAGNFVKKYGPKKMGILAGILFGLGIIGSGIAIHFQSLYGLYIGYGVIGGIGLGIGYLVPVPTLIKRFPNNKGLASGLAIMGFGFAALLISPIMKSLMGSIGVEKMFYLLGTVYLFVIVGASLYLADPQEQKSQVANVKNDEITTKRVLKSPRFYLLWTMFFINILGGITIISNASPMAQDMIGMSVIAATLMVGIMGAFNGGGRFLWAALSDYIGRLPVYMIFFALQIALFLLLPHLASVWMFQVCIFIIMTCYGGGFSCMPSFVAELFGDKAVGQVRGMILTAWAAAGLVGPLLSSWLKTTTKSYTAVLSLYAGLFALALILSRVLRMNIRKAKK